MADSRSGHILRAAAWLPWLATAALAAEPSSVAPDTGALDEVTITASRAPRARREVAATVSVIDTARLERELVGDIGELVRYEPGVTVRNATGRFGLTDFNIRGIDGNRVLLEVDGVRLPDAFAIGSFSNATRDGVDVDLLKRVEIVRGSASALHGSNAIGGVVAFTTKDPDDLLRGDARLGGSVKLAYGEDDDGRSGTAALAARGGDWSGLLAYTRRDSGTLANMGERTTFDATRTAPNPQDAYADSVLAKALWRPAANHLLRLTLEQLRSDVSSDVISLRSSTPTLAVLGILGDDEQQRSRQSLEHEFRDLEGWPFDGGEWRIWRQRSTTTQYTRETRRVVGAAATSLRERRRTFEFDDDGTGLELTLRRAFDAAGAAQQLTVGLELAANDIAQQRDGSEINITTGAASNVVGTDVFPVRDTPLSRVRQAGLFVQHELRWKNWSLTPALRVDRYELEPTLDAVFAADNPGIVPVGLTDTHVSPRLGVIRRWGESWSAYASYASGFRAPPYADVNVGFTNLIARYTAIPNAALRPETSDNLELGLRYAQGATFATLALYHDRYDDFIESFSLVGTQPGTGLLVFQSRNLGEVEIRGVEFSGRLPVGSAAAGLALRTALSWGVGDDRVADAPLDSVDPPRAVVGLEYRPVAAPWGAELVITAVDRKRRIDQAGGPFFAPPGWVRVDLLGEWRIATNARLNAGLFNVADRKYWEWAEVRGRLASDAALDFYTRPGRTAAVQLRFDW